MPILSQMFPPDQNQNQDYKKNLNHVQSSAQSCSVGGITAKQNRKKNMAVNKKREDGSKAEGWNENKMTEKIWKFFSCQYVWTIEQREKLNFFSKGTHVFNKLGKRNRFIARRSNSSDHETKLTFDQPEILVGNSRSGSSKSSRCP